MILCFQPVFDFRIKNVFFEYTRESEGYFLQTRIKSFELLFSGFP